MTSSDSIPRSNSNAVAMSTPRKENPDNFANSSIKKNNPNPLNEKYFELNELLFEIVLCYRNFNSKTLVCEYYDRLLLPLPHPKPILNFI